MTLLLTWQCTGAMHAAMQLAVFVQTQLKLMHAWMCSRTWIRDASNEMLPARCLCRLLQIAAQLQGKWNVVFSVTFAMPIATTQVEGLLLSKSV